MSEQQAFIQSMIDAISQPVVVLCAYDVMFMNKTLCGWLEHAPECAVETLFDLVHPSSYDRLNTLDLHTIQKAHIQSFLQFRKAKNENVGYPAHVHIAPAPFIGENYTIATISDLSVQHMLTDARLDTEWLNHLPVSIYRVDHEGIIEYANHTMAVMFGYDSAQVLIGEPAHILYDTDPSVRENLLNKWLDEGTIHDVRPFRRKDGTTFIGRDIGRVEKSEHHTVLYTVGSIQDITDQRRQSSLLEQRHRELFVLNRIAREINSTIALEEILERILDHAKEVIPYTSASIFLLEDEHILTPIAMRGIPDTINIDDLQFTTDDLFGGKLSNHQQRALLISDVTQHAEWREIEGSSKIHSWIGVPLWHNDLFLGMLNFDHSVSHFFTEEHLEMADAIGQHAAISIRNGQLYAQSQREIAKKERIYDELVDNLIRTQTVHWVLEHLVRAETITTNVLMDALAMLNASQQNTRFTLYVFNTDTGELMHHPYILNNDDSTWDIFKALVQEPDLAQYEMPAHDLDWDYSQKMLHTDDQQVFASKVYRRGLIASIRSDDDAPFTEAECELIQTVAYQLSIIIEKNILNERLKRQNDYLDQLVDKRTQQLEAEQRHVQAILDATAEGIFYMEDDHIQYANQAFCDMMGYSLSELFGKSLDDIKGDNSLLKANRQLSNMLTDAKQISEDDSIQRHETRLKRQDGTEFHANIHYSQLENEDGVAIRIVAVVRDVSQERALYFQRSQFITNAAHELRNPLSSLGLRLHLLQRNPVKAADYIPNLQRIYDHIVVLVEELVDLSRYNRGTIELTRKPIVLQPIVRAAVDTQLPYASEQSITLQVDLPDDPINILADETRILQMMNNLIINGIDYNSEGGTVIIKIRVDKTPIMGDCVFMEVVDDGEGIDPDLLPNRIFEPFARYSQGNRQETGMGLSLAHEIVRLHNGTIHAESAIGEGSSFHVKLPLSL